MKKMNLVLGCLILLGAMSATAQVPSGPFTYVFTNLPIWDVTGSYTNVISTNSTTDTVIMNLIHSARGKITGTRTDTIAGVGAATSAIIGKVAAKNGVAGAKVIMKGTFSAEGLEGLASGKGTATIDDSTLTIDVAGVMKLCLKTSHGNRCESFSADTSSALPAGTDGDWELDTNITATGTKLTGTATVTLSNDRILTYNVIGTYVTATEVAKLKLTGTGNALGTSFNITTHGMGMDLTALKGKVMGQMPVFP